ncbi:type II toxin-antitoxin system HicA family toxin [Clostridium perfringens]
MKSYSSREIVKIITKDGWYEVNCVGDHHQYKHLTKKGRLTIPHPKKDLPIGTVRSIFKQAGIKIL